MGYRRIGPPLRAAIISACVLVRRSSMDTRRGGTKRRPRLPWFALDSVVPCRATADFPGHPLKDGNLP